MTDLPESPSAKPKRRPRRRWKIVLTALVLAGLAATWQQGLLEDGLNELRRYGAEAALPPPEVGSTAIQTFDSRAVSTLLAAEGSLGSETMSSDTVNNLDSALLEIFDPWTTPTVSGIDLERLRHAAVNLDRVKSCPRASSPDRLHDVVEILRFADGCLLLEYENLRDRSVEEARQTLYVDPSVLAVDRPAFATPLQASPDPRRGDQWHLDEVNTMELAARWPVGADVTIAVIDTGVDGSHGDLDANLLTGYGISNGLVDTNGHGTHVAGIIAAEMDNGFGGTGVASSVKILPIRHQDLRISEALQNALDERVDIINMSFGLWETPGIFGDDSENLLDNSFSEDPNQTVEGMIRLAQLHGILVVASAGNCGREPEGRDPRCLYDDQILYPAGFPGVISVAATTESGERALFSSRGTELDVAAARWVDIAAPGDNIFSTVPNDGIEPKDGTSMAAPIVSAVLAHLVARFPTAHPASIVSSLYVTAENPDGEIRTDEFGYGIVRPLEAIRWLEANLADLGEAPAIDFDGIEESTGETPVILIADASGSMGEVVGGEVKLESAKRLMLEFLSTVSPTREIALRTYPSLGGRDCSDGELRIGFSSRTLEMDAVIRALHPDGDTPTAEALRTAVSDIRDAGFSQAEIALFSDGLYTCADPCQIADEIVASGIDIRVHIGSFVESNEGRSNLECISDKTEGSYMEGSEVEGAFAAELGEFLERNSRPRLAVRLTLPESVAPSTDPSRSQQVEVVVLNDSNVAARDVVVSFETQRGTELARHSVSVGNISPGAESLVSWELRPGFANVGADLGLDVTVTAANTEDVATATGSVAVEDPNVADEAGPILGVGQIVVMGDQLLSGVGTSTRGTYGGCRRSREIGLLEVFGQPAERSLACANALMAHLAAPDWAKDVDSQINQLADLMEGEGAISAVVLSIGATDFGLSDLARECVMSTVPCDSVISGVPTDEWLGESIAGGGPRHVAASTQLVRAFGTVDQALNETRDRSRGTRQVPILLLAQPRAFPFIHGACFERWQGEGLPLMTQPELNLYHHFVSVVNGTLEAAAVASQDLGLPVFFVETTESAYLPDHTACSAEPYVQSLEPLAETGSGVIRTLSEGGIAAVASVEFNEDALVELSEEFLAPNEYGEQALANAVLRWSQSDEAQDADDFVSDEFQRRSTGIARRVSAPTLGETRPFTRPGRPAVEPGRGWTASTPGFLPGALVTASIVPGERVVASAVADENGTAELYVVVPRDVAAGDVTLVARGLSRSGQAISVEQPARVLPPLRPIHSVALPALAVLLLLSSVGLWRVSRRKVTLPTPLQEENQ